MVSDDTNFIVASNLVLAIELRRSTSQLQHRSFDEKHEKEIIKLFSDMVAYLSDLKQK